MRAKQNGGLLLREKQARQLSTCLSKPLTAQRCSHRLIEPSNHWTKNLKSLKNMVCCRLMPGSNKIYHESFIARKIHMTSRRTYWCSKLILWELNSFLSKHLLLVPINLHRYRPLKGLFTWKWGTPGRCDNPLSWCKKITLRYMQSSRGAHFEDYWMVAKHSNKKNASKPHVLAINALLHSRAPLATTFSAVAFYCYL